MEDCELGAFVRQKCSRIGNLARGRVRRSKKVCSHNLWRLLWVVKNHFQSPDYFCLPSRGNTFCSQACPLEVFCKFPLSSKIVRSEKKWWFCEKMCFYCGPYVCLLYFSVRVHVWCIVPIRHLLHWMRCITCVGSVDSDGFAVRGCLLLWYWECWHFLQLLLR